MTDLLSWIPLESGRDLGWALLHFLWQGLVLAALLNTILPLCRSAAARHACALATLAMMALAPVATFLSLHDAAKNTGAAFADAAAGAFASGPVALPWMTWLLALWLAGIAVLSLRALGGWYLAGSLGHRGTLAVPDDLLRRCHGLHRRLAVAWPARFLLSRRIDAPVVIGWLRPVILIPVSALAGLAPAQLDALILHELAHIRRFDTLVNVLLTAVETLLFYHPAVWWVSRHIRIEREHCCDDLAVSACGDAATYVEALTLLKPWKTAGSIALGATGGSLKDRVARLLGAPAEPRRVSLSAMTGLALLGLVAGTVAMAAPAPHGKVAVTDIQPIRETHTLPPYPKESVHLQEQGRVLLGVTIGTNGAVSRAMVVKASGHPRLDDAALQFVKSHWRWQPATRAGKPVVTKTRVSILFNLKPPKAPKSR